MDKSKNKNRYVTLRTKSLNSAQIIRFQTNENESLFDKVKSVLSENCSSKEEISKISNSPLYVRLGELQISNLSSQNEHLQKKEHSLKSLEIPEHHDVTLLAETEPTNFYDHYHVLRFHTPKGKHVDLFKRWEAEMKEKGVHLDVWHPPRSGLFADVKTFKHIVPSIKDCGLKVDVHPYFIKEKVKNTFKICGTHYHDKFHPYREVKNYLQKIKERCDGVGKLEATLFSLGKTIGNQEILGIKITVKNSTFGKREKIVMTSGIHAREWVSVSSNTFFLDMLTEMKDIRLNEILNKSDFYLVPVLNVDGYNLSFVEGFRLWRKNVHSIKKDPSLISGVDINRNFEDHFKTGKNSNEDDYSGPFAHSEPETKNIANFYKELARDGPILMSLDLHCYQKSICFPLCHSKDRPVNYEDSLECSKRGKDAIRKVKGTEYMVGQVSLKIYPCSGTMMDYLYDNKLSKYSFVNELDGENSMLSTHFGFLTDPKEIRRIGTESAEGAIAMIEYLLEINPTTKPNQMRLIPNNQKLLNATNTPKSNFKHTLSISENAVSLHSFGSRINTRSINGRKILEQDRFYTPVGLYNRGMTCFINSVLQSFAAIEDVFHCLNQVHLDGKRGFVPHFKNVLMAFWNKDERVIENSKRSMEELLNETFRSSKNMKRNSQGDASEFALICANKIIEEGIDKSGLFKGELLKKVHGNFYVEPFFHIALPTFQSNDVQYCIEKFFSKDILEDKTMMSSTIKKYPKVLLITLKGVENRRNSLSIPFTLDLSNYSVEKNCGKYVLKSMINFFGRDNLGHYTATIKSPNGEWIEASDTNIVPSGIGKDSNEIQRNNVRILFYSLKRMPEKISKTTLYY